MENDLSGLRSSRRRLSGRDQWRSPRSGLLARMTSGWPVIRQESGFDRSITE